MVNGRQACPINFGDDVSRERWFAKVEEARAAQRSKHAVAPDCTITTPSGKVLTAGMATRQVDFIGHDSLAAWQLFEHHVREGRILESYTVLTDNGPSAA